MSKQIFLRIVIAFLLAMIFWLLISNLLVQYSVHAPLEQRIEDLVTNQSLTPLEMCKATQGLKQEAADLDASYSGYTGVVIGFLFGIAAVMAAKKAKPPELGL